MIQTQTGLKLIDLGGVRWIDDEQSAIYGTDGFQAPEIAADGPSVSSDLYTVGRTLAALSLDVKGFASTHKYRLPSPAQAPLLAAADAYHRLLRRATDPDPARRFVSAAELAEQLAGVLRESLAAADGSPRPAASTMFGPEPQSFGDADDAQLDPAWLAGSLPVPRARGTGGWRDTWRVAVEALAGAHVVAARDAFEVVYDRYPGEAAPKLAIAACAEYTAASASGSAAREAAALAARHYETVWRTDRSYLGAAFGLARARLVLGDRDGAVAALDGVPEGSHRHRAARTAAFRACLQTPPGALTQAGVTDLADRLERLELEPSVRGELTAGLLESVLSWLRASGTGRAASRRRSRAPVAGRVLGVALSERAVRRELERTYRVLAQQAEHRSDRIALVDLANRVRTRSWV